MVKLVKCVYFLPMKETKNFYTNIKQHGFGLTTICYVTNIMAVLFIVKSKFNI